MNTNNTMTLVKHDMHQKHNKHHQHNLHL
jgi:hypothetical protein